MRVIGIVAEFNPFHKGHEYLIKKAREIVGDKRAVVMCVMSGPITQRGIPACLPKHVRTRQALNCGADLVIELPFRYACAPSPVFAEGAIRTLIGTGVLTDLAFGIDSDNPEELITISQTDFENNEDYKNILKEKLSEGISFPKARATAIASVMGDPELQERLNKPNTILALDYLSALKKSGRSNRIKVHMIKREGEGYKSEVTDTEEFLSATAIRELIEKSNTKAELANNLAGKMPDKSLASMLASGYSCPDMSAYERDLLSDVLSKSADQLGQYAYMGDNLNGYIKNVAENLKSGESFFEKLPTKHFVMSRILRALTCTYLNISKDEMEYKAPSYIRVLGFAHEGRYCLKIIGKCSKLPIIHNLSDALEIKDENLRESIRLDILASDYQGKLMGLPVGYERNIPPVIVK